MTKENDEKKKYLDRYRRARSSAKELESRLAMLQIDAMVPGQRAADAMPHGSGGDRDLSDYVAKYDEYVTALIRKRQAAQSVMIEVSTAIEALEIEEEKQVLLYRYIHLMRWDEIAEAMHIALRTAFYWHGQALAHFKIPNCIDMQSPSR
jgi:DNA-directed RNA polymerase specialized sigma24 family protein